MNMDPQNRNRICFKPLYSGAQKGSNDKKPKKQTRRPEVLAVPDRPQKNLRSFSQHQMRPSYVVQRLLGFLQGEARDQPGEKRNGL